MGGGELTTAQIIADYGVGIDCHSKFIQVCLLTRVDDAVLRDEAEFSTTWECLKDAVSWVLQRLVERIDNPPSADLLSYTLESTGCYHIPVVLAFGGEPHLVNPVLAGSTKRKTDVLDARLLAYHSITGMWPATFLARVDTQCVRIWEGHRRRLSRERTRLLNTTNNIVLRFGHTFGALTPPNSATGWSIIEDLADGKLPRMPGVSPLEIPASVRPVMKDIIERVGALNKQIKSVSASLVAECKAGEYGIGGGELVSGERLHPIIQTHPGIGALSAAIWLCEIVDAGRFRNAKVVSALCGLDPTLKVSAGHVTRHVRRMGNKRLNVMLIQAAKGLINRRKEELGRWGYAISRSKRQGGYKKAAGSVARRICMNLWAMHRKCEPYDVNKSSYWRPKVVPNMPVSGMGLGRFAATLEASGLRTSQEVAAAYNTDLASRKGVGEKCLAAVRQWLSENQASSCEEKSSGEASERSVKPQKKS